MYKKERERRLVSKKERERETYCEILALTFTHKKTQRKIKG